ncbi:Exosome complex component RRP45 [Auxenochlorella protothecoides]|uniref:Exosome complex component RRP45 n=1 Tax=Auxenochlorella protothecoides TaxID=3075 RepID=A0A087SFV4_AUXPR|nr:Exosome complex component RRP45 [Auxenochlorella protothecoides]KFM24608.1 Exosome complex component RRP45 [Auxenochlorella protothecoides]
MAIGPLSNLERDFIQNAIAAGVREDGRGPYDSRTPSFSFFPDDSGCVVALGDTLVSAGVSATLRPPFPDRPNEGSLRVSARLTPLAAPGSDPGARSAPEAEELALALERGLRDGRAVDLEALTVLPGRKVWHLDLALTVMGAGGGLLDAAGLAALAAVCAHRRPATRVDDAARGLVSLLPPGTGETQPLSMHHLPVPVTFALFPGGHLAPATRVDGAARGLVSLLPPGTGETQPLSMHHLPVPVTFALFPGGHLAVDPTAREERAAAGALALVLTPQGEVCAARKARGAGCAPSQLLRCARLGRGVAEERIAEGGGPRPAEAAAHEGVVAASTGSELVDEPMPERQPAPEEAATSEGDGALGGALKTDIPAEVLEVDAGADAAMEEAEAPTGTGGDTTGPAAGPSTTAAEAAGTPAPANPSQARVESASQAGAGSADAGVAAGSGRKKKRRKARAAEAAADGQAEDPYAAIAEMIARAGKAAAPGTAPPADLRSAMRTQQARQRKQAGK